MPIAAERAQVELRRRSAITELQRREGQVAFPSRDPDKAITFGDTTIPPVDIPEIADPQDVTVGLLPTKDVPTYFERTRKAWQRGQANVNMDFLWRQEMLGKITEKDVLGAEKKWEELNKTDPIEGRNFVENLLLQTTQILPAMVGGYREGLKYGVAGAGAAAIAGQVGPQVLAPEELFTVPGAFVGGQAVGSLKYWSEQGQGAIYREARKVGVSKDTAIIAASIGGPIYGWIEHSQVDKIIPGLGRVKGRLTKLLIKYAGSLARETAEEGFQKVVTDTAVKVGQIVEGQIKVADIPEEVKQTLLNSLNEMKGAVGPMGLLLLPGGAVSIARTQAPAKAPDVLSVGQAPVEVAKVTPQKRQQAIDFVKDMLTQEQYAALDEKAKIEIGQRLLAEQGVEVGAEELVVTPPTEAIAAPDVATEPITKPEAVEEAPVPPKAKPDDTVRPKLHIGNITARMRKVAAEEFGVKPEDVGPFLEGAFPTKKAEIPMSRTEAAEALVFIEQSLDARLENNLIRTEKDLTQANIDWADIKALRIVLDRPVGARPFTVTRAEKPQIAIIDTGKKLADQTVPALKEITETLGLETKGTKAELVARIEIMAAESETTAESFIRLAQEEVSKRAVKILRTTKDVIKAAIKPSSIIDAGLSADKVLQVVMKKAEVVSAKAWLESAREIVQAHKDLAAYIKERMEGIGLSASEQNRLLQMVAKGRTATERIKITAAVEMLVSKVKTRQANKNLEAVIRKFKKKVGKTVWKGGLWPNAQQKIENLLSAITTKKITEKTLNDARSLRNYLERAKEQIENDFDADLAESLIPSSRLKLLDTVTRDQTRLLTPQGIEAITQEIERVINLNDVKSKWFIFGKINRSRTLLKNIEGEVREGKTRRSAEKEIGKYEVKRGIFRMAADIGIGLNNDDLYTLAKIIVGKEGYLEDVVDTDIRKGTEKTYEVLQTALKIFNEKIASAGVTAKDMKRMSSEFDTWTPSALFKRLLTPTSTVAIKGKKIKLTQGQLIDIYLYAQQEQSLDYMLKNPQNYFNNINVGKLTAQELRDVLGKLSPKAKIVADAMSEVLNTYVKGELANTQLKLDGINIFTIPNHWHIEHPREGRISGQQTYVSEKIELQDFMKPRVGSRTGIVNRDAFVRFRKVLAGSAEYIGYAEPLRTLRMVLNNTNITDAIKAQGYRAELNAMKTIVKRAQDTSPLIDDLSNLSSRMLRGFIRSTLALKVDIGAMQATSAALYLNFIEAKYLTPLTVRGFFTRSELKEAIEHSPFLWARWTLGHQSMEVGYLAQTDATLRLFMGKAHKANWTMKHLQVGDMVAMLNGWRIAKKYVKNTTTHKVGSQEYWSAVSKKANYLWYRTQPVYDKFGRSVNTSTPGLARHAFIFRSFRQKALQNIHNSGKFGNKTRSVAIVLTTLALGELLKAMIRWPLFDEKPDPKELAKKLVTSPLSLLAVVGYPAQSIVSNMIDRAIGDTPRWSEVELSLPIFGMVNKSLQSVNYTSQAIGFQLSGDREKAKEYGFKAIKNMTEALATYFGAPVSFFRAFTRKKKGKKKATQKSIFKRRGASTSRKTIFKKRTQQWTNRNSTN